MSPWNRWEDSPYTNQKGPQLNGGTTGHAPTAPHVLVNDPDFTLYVGDVLEQLRELPDESVHCVVTSPPYWGLRDYGTGSWAGGDPDCDHLAPPGGGTGATGLQQDGRSEQARQGNAERIVADRRQQYRDVCGKCGATRIDQQLGLESTPDLFVARMVEVFREVRRVLRADGTCWVNLGDSYNNRSVGRKSSHQGGLGFESEDLSKSWAELTQEGRTRLSINDGVMKEKDLCGIPWRVAFALQADGWYLRSDIVWSKPNPMPESVTDRPTKAHEYVFLLTRSPRYLFDQEAVREAFLPSTLERSYTASKARDAAPKNKADPMSMQADGWTMPNVGRNVRSVWEIATQPYPEAHFATFPEALPERCIKAGTSERGCCPECGAPWERQSVVSYEPTTRTPPPNKGHVGAFLGEKAAGMTAGGFIPNRDKQVQTLGWTPSCSHKRYEVMTDTWVDHTPVPCTVLDPFMGSGTTALVARRLGRRSIGIELNPDYAALCARRLQQLSLFAGEPA